MPIAVACQCGQRFQAKDELAGKVVKCPKCGQALRIPSPRPQAQPSPQLAPTPPNSAAHASTPANVGGPGSLDDLFDEVGIEQSQSGMRCTQCGKPMPAGGVLCVHCGYNHETGERIRRVSGDGEEDELDESFGNAQLDRAAKHIRYREEESKKTNDLLPWWTYLIALIVLACFVVGMAMLPTSVAVMVSGGLLIGLAMLASLAGQIWVVVVAFKDSTMQGILVLFVPFYFFIYVFKHWDECGAAFYLWLGGQAASFVAGLVVAFAPALMGDEDEFGLLPRPERPPAVARLVITQVFSCQTLQLPRNAEPSHGEYETRTLT